MAEEDGDDVDDDDDDDDDEEAAAEPPCRFALVVFLAALGEAGINLPESSCTSMISKLSWLSMLDDFFTLSGFMPFLPELLGRGRDSGPVFVTSAAEGLSAWTTCFVFPICS